MADYVYIFDTTLRDGEQSPGCSMNVEEKLQVARMLDELGFDSVSYFLERKRHEVSIAAALASLREAPLTVPHR